MQNTIVITTFGYAIGQLFFGVLSDWKGRRLSIILGLLLFCVAKLFAMHAHSLEALLLARALQGFSVGSCQVVSRAVLVDTSQADVLKCRSSTSALHLRQDLSLAPTQEVQSRRGMAGVRISPSMLPTGAFFF